MRSPNCGAESAAKTLSSRIKGLGAPDARAFELFVLTHIDADHINGVLPLFADTTLNALFEDIWFNAYDKMVKDEEAELLRRGMQNTEMGAEQKAKLQAAWATAQWDLAEKKSGQEARDLRALLKSKGLTD